MGLLNGTDELDIFDTIAVQELISFKWDSYALTHHLVGCFFHFFYLAILIIYINIIYIKDTGTVEDKITYVILLAIGIIYPLSYNIARIYNQGFAFFGDISNWLDFLFAACSTVNCFAQIIFNPFHLVSKILMILIILLGLLRTFTFLKIVASLSPIVTMLTNVVYDLRIFLFFYLILTVLFSLLLGIIGLGNRFVEGPFKDLYGDDAKNEALQAAISAGEVDEGTELDAFEWEYPGIEYEVVGLFVGNIISTLRMSLGDFGFDAAIELEQAENYIYWVVWILIILVTCIIFLNFIIAEASASYEKVSEFLELYIEAEKAALIQQAEEMNPRFLKNEKQFPTYIVTREKED